MSKLNDVESKLSQINDSIFHSLVDAYLAKKYNYSIQSIGKKVAEDKPTKGTPDTVVLLSNGFYIFAEYTTQKSNIVDKFIDDIEKCLNETKTGIRVEKIILACNSKLSTSDIEILRQKCYPMQCEIITISSLAHDIFSNFPSLTKEFLSINIDTHQILDANEFIKKYQSYKLATPLDNGFYFREEEKKQIYDSLNSTNIILISGKSGAGKTKIALEVLKDFSNENGYTVYCILNNGLNIYDDLVSYLSKDSKFIVLIDDVNRASSVLDYLWSIFFEKIKNGSIKIVATVRDYALNKVKEKINSFDTATSEISMGDFTDKEINEIIRKGFDVTNPVYLERIEKISAGNIRLAVMMAKTAKQENKFEAIINIESLYDNYFDSINKDSNLLEDTNLLKAVVIISFFRQIDKTNEKQQEIIKKVFGFEMDTFWSFVHKLNDFEIVDLYENEVVKISDQVVSTYLFYLSVFKKEILTIDLFFENLFVEFPERFKESIYPIYDAFDRELLNKKLLKAINKLWDIFEKNGNDESLLKLMDVFWFLKQEETLLFLNNKVQLLEKEEAGYEIIFDENKDYLYPENKYLNILKLFYASGNYASAIEVIFNYLEKKPSIANKILQVLIKDYGLNSDSYMYGYSAQGFLVDLLFAKSRDCENQIFIELFFKVAKNFLRTVFDYTRAGRGRTVTWGQYKLVETDELKKLREKIWDMVFHFFEYSEIKVLNLVLHYIDHMGYIHGISDIKDWDKEKIINLISSRLDNSKLIYCEVAQKCFERFSELGLEFDKSLIEKYTNEIYLISKVFYQNDRLYWRKNEDLSSEDIDKLIKQKMYDYINSHNLEDFKTLFVKLESIKNESIETDNYGFYNNICLVFVVLAENKQELFIDVINFFKNSINTFGINCQFIVRYLLSILGKEQALNFIEESTFNLKTRWLFEFYANLNKDEIATADSSGLLKLYNIASFDEMPYHLDYLVKYAEVDSDFILKVVDSVLDKAKTDEKCIKNIEFIFNPYSEINKNISKYFKPDYTLLQKAYLALDSFENHFDHDCANLNTILDLDSQFIYKYLDSTDIKNKYDCKRDHSLLWKRDDWKNILNSIVEKLIEKKDGRFNNTECFFVRSEKDYDIVLERQKAFLTDYIQKNCIDCKKIKFIFEVIAENMPNDTKKEFLQVFTNLNSDFKCFEKLQLLSSITSWSGSAVPEYQKKLDFYISLLDIFEGSKYLAHKTYIRQHIEWVKKDITREQKHDFLSSDF